ncbi:MAG: HU family DNA-binding protein [Prevotella sp.]|nr:HU family DNA-binding protein [Prevotella sp.]
MSRIYLDELATELAEKRDISQKQARLFLKALVETIQKGIGDDGLVKVKGLGTFKLIDIDARESVSVNTGERVMIEGHQKLAFIPDAAMKELVNRPFSMFETVILNK